MWPFPIITITWAGNIPEGYALDEFVARFIDGRFDRKWGPGATMY